MNANRKNRRQADDDGDVVEVEEEGTEFRVSIRRTVSTAQFESVSVELSSNFRVTEEEGKDFSTQYKEFSRKVQRAVRHEIDNYTKPKRGEEKEAPRRVR